MIRHYSLRTRKKVAAIDSNRDETSNRKIPNLIVRRLKIKIPPIFRDSKFLNREFHRKGDGIENVTFYRA
ncbi:hypothetical protein CH375_01790 [Leptospira ellisii]|nr:hypothetical protein CH375_01790 [Leptospira ellisii]